jgi:RimJ/RimL family protein N-acetyltransferase
MMQLTVLARLPDRTPVLIRSIRPDDKRMLANGLRHLSETSVQRRFLSAKPRLSTSELRYLTEVDGHNHVALVAENPVGPGRRLIAVARYVRLPDDPAAAEAAIVVGDDWHGRGRGSLLATQLARAARTNGIERFTATMASDNVAAHRLLARLTRELHLRRMDHGVSDVTLDLVA